MQTTVGDHSFTREDLIGAEKAIEAQIKKNKPEPPSSWGNDEGFDDYLRASGAYSTEL